MELTARILARPRMPWLAAVDAGTVVGYAYARYGLRRRWLQGAGSSCRRSGHVPHREDDREDEDLHRPWQAGQVRRRVAVPNAVPLDRAHLVLLAASMSIMLVVVAMASLCCEDVRDPKTEGGW